MVRVFLSHAPDDDPEAAADLAARLREAGHDVVVQNENDKEHNKNNDDAHSDGLSEAPGGALHETSPGGQRHGGTRSRNRLLVGVGAVVVVIVLVATAVVTWRHHTADRDRQRTRVAAARALDRAADSYREWDPQLALQLATAAARLDPGPDTRDWLAGILFGTTAPVPLTGHTRAVVALAYSPDGTTLATGGNDGTVRLWDVGVPDRARLAGAVFLQPQQRADFLAALTFSPDGRTLAVVTNLRGVRLWNVTDRRQPVPLGSLPTSAAISAATFGPDSRTLATGDLDGNVRLWDLTDGRAPKPLGAGHRGHHNTVLALVYGPDGRTLASSGLDGTELLWSPDLSTWVELPAGSHTRFDYVDSLVFDPAGTMLATVTVDGQVSLWDVRDPLGGPRMLSTLPRDATRSTATVAFRPDGRTLATVGDGITVPLWRITDPRRPTLLAAPPTGHAGRVLTVAFSPDGKGLATGSTDRTAGLWAFDRLESILADPLAEACRRGGGGLSGRDWARYAPDVPARDACAG